MVATKPWRFGHKLVTVLLQLIETKMRKGGLEPPRREPLDPKTKNGHLRSLPKSNENNLKPATGAGLSLFETTEEIRALP